MKSRQNFYMKIKQAGKLWFIIFTSSSYIVTIIKVFPSKDKYNKWDELSNWKEEHLTHVTANLINCFKIHRCICTFNILWYEFWSTIGIKISKDTIIGKNSYQTPSLDEKPISTVQKMS